MKTDPRFGLEMDKDELDKDETKIIHLFNLVTHESEIPSLERTKTAVRSIILLESLKQSDYFKVNFEGPFLFVQNNGWTLNNPNILIFFFSGSKFIFALIICMFCVKRDFGKFGK